MKHIKRFFKKIFILTPFQTALTAIPVFALSAYVLAVGRGAAVKAAAVVSGLYAAAVTLVGTVRAVAAAETRIDKAALKSRFHLGFTARAKASLSMGLAINLGYAATKLAGGIYYRSLWFISLAVYYILLAAVRFFLLKHVRISGVGKHPESEYKISLLCGVLLLIMNIALIVIVILIVFQNKSGNYPGALIYAMAAYSVYSTVIAALNFARHRRAKSAVWSTVKVVNLTASIVSFLSLEAAVLTRLDRGADAAFRRTLTAATGGAVCVIAVSMAVWMIAKSRDGLRRLNAGKMPAK